MPLNNEPRSKTTESIVGIIILVGVIWILLTIDYYLVAPMLNSKGQDPIVPMVFGIFFMVMCIIVLGALLALAHTIGEIFCNRLENKGIYLYPINKPDNTAFDEYKRQELQRLEQEGVDFKAFLERLRMAKDQEVFDQFQQEWEKKK